MNIIQIGDWIKWSIDNTPYDIGDINIKVLRLLWLEKSNTEENYLNLFTSGGF